MQKLGEIKLENTFQIKVQCLLNEQVIVSNFRIIMDCLKDLNQNHKDLAGKFEKLEDRVQIIQDNSYKQGGKNESKEKQLIEQSAKEKQSASETGATGNLSESDKQNLLALIRQLQSRTNKNERNIDDNIKDINLINKQIQDLKDLIAKLQSHNENNKANSSHENSKTSQSQGQNSAFVLNVEGMNNINTEMQNNKETILKTNEELERLRKELEDIKEKLNRILGDHNQHSRLLEEIQKKNKNNVNYNADLNNSSNQNDDNSGGSGSSDGLSRAQLKELKEKIVILNKKTNGLELISDSLKTETTALGEGQILLENTCNNLTEETNRLKQGLHNLLRSNQNIKNNDNLNNYNSNNNSSSSKDLENELRTLKKEINQIRSQIEDLKKDQVNSRTSIQDEKKGRIDRAAYTHARFKDNDTIKELMARVDYLEKIMGSKNFIGDKLEGMDKLPIIKRGGKGFRDRQSSTNQDKSTSKKEIAQVRADLQAWFNNYLADLKSKDNFQQIELKIQEIRNSLNKKADQQGLKKGLAFLQAKINQLYLFLTEPQGDDAMIVRKGFNCLSCSKKVQKLRGKIGPHINWSNMTATSYSPPKVGYSRHLGDNNSDKQEEV